MTINLSQMYDRLASFDTETTGLNVSKSNIWQLGFTNSSISVESEVNPFLLFNEKKGIWKQSKHTTNTYVAALRKSNSTFSEESYKSGAFSNNIQAFNNKTITNVNEGFKRTIGNISNDDILVMQNHKFENRLLLDKRLKGMITEKDYNDVRDKFKYVSTKDEGLFSTPAKVQSILREAEFKRYSLSSKYKDNKSYADSMNKVIDAYKDEFSKSNGKAIVVEQMDITKALYANAIQHGYLKPQNSNIGLSIDFLTNSLYGEKEKHTALSDSKHTLKVFKDTWGMIEELRTGNVSAETKTHLRNINRMQEDEFLNQFNKTVSSTLDDFNTRGSTSTGFHRSTNELLDTTSNIVHTVNSVSVGSERYTSDFNKSMDEIVNRYGNRSDISSYVESIKDMYANNKTFEEIGNAHKVSASLGKDQFNKIKIPEKGIQIKTIATDERMPKSLKIGLAVAAGLGYMAMKDSPRKEDTNNYVSQEFYDDQYLGTVFFESENRNKHYMY